MPPPFIWKTYKGCKILATGKYNPETGYWTPKATVYWKRQREKHLLFMDGPQDSYSYRADAEQYALASAVQWCDQNILGELVNAPRP
jgi:hypothetical protein